VRELAKMWENTRMVVLAAVTAAVYAALLIPFKPLTIIPGLTEASPGRAIPFVAGLLFGPAGAVGSAFGNLLADFSATLGLGSLFGLGGNFLLAYIPYRIVRAGDQEYLTNWRRLLLMEAAILLAALACGLFIGWGIDLVGQAPFAALANIIVVNNVIFTVPLGPLFLKALDKRVRRLGLLYPDVLDVAPRRPRTFLIGLILVVVACVGGMVAGNYISLGVKGHGVFASALGPDFPVGLGVAPFVALLVIGVLLI